MAFMSNLYERANKNLYDLLNAPDLMANAGNITKILANDIFPTFIPKIGDVIARGDNTTRNYSFFKIPLSQFGDMTEYLASNMIRPADSVAGKNGDVINDFVINNPDIRALYAQTVVSANYPLSIQDDKLMDLIDRNDTAGIARHVAIAMQCLQDGIEHDTDMLVPALAGVLYNAHKEKLPKSIFTLDNLDELSAANITNYSTKLVATFKNAIYSLGTYRKKEYNLMGCDMADSLDNLCLVCFDNPINSNTSLTAIDLLESFFEVAPQMRASGLKSILGCEVYRMPSAGVVTADIQRAYGLPNFGGMQTADMSNANYTRPHPELMFALVGRGAFNVGLKRLISDTTRSSQGHLTQTWIQKSLQLAYGAGQAIFFVAGA